MLVAPPRAHSELLVVVLVDGGSLDADVQYLCNYCEDLSCADRAHTGLLHLTTKCGCVFENFHL